MALRHVRGSLFDDVAQTVADSTQSRHVLTTVILYSDMSSTNMKAKLQRVQNTSARVVLKPDVGICVPTQLNSNQLPVELSWVL